MPQKTKRATRTAHKRNHLRPLHMLRLYSFGALAVALLSIQILAGVQTQTQQRQDVLAYATNVSVGDLLAATNQARAANGLGPLALNSQLNNGAQAKANDMIAKNYWSHNSPDGTQPWQFFTAHGYQYQKAGENLAYGFATSGQTVDGWMNSAGHRANVLGAYQDIGFGIASGATYQGSENTVIVAFYAVPYTPPAPPPAPAPAAIAPTSTPIAATPAQTTTPTPAPTLADAEPVPTLETTEQQAQPANETKNETVEKDNTVVASQPKRITAMESLLTGNGTWAMYASMSAVGITTMGFAGTHLQLIRRGWKVSKHYILVHPALDAAVLAALLATLLTSTTGFIK